MATVPQIRDALKVRLATITGLRAYDIWPSQVILPAALIRPVSGSYYETLGGDDTAYRFEVTVLVKQVTFEISQDALDGYLAPTGATSIRTAIDGDRTLAGLVDQVFVVGWRDYGILEVNGKTYFGAIVDLDVRAR